MARTVRNICTAAVRSSLKGGDYVAYDKQQVQQKSNDRWTIYNFRQ